MQSRRISSAGPAWRAPLARLLHLLCWPRWSSRSEPAAASAACSARKRLLPTSRRRSSTTRASSCSTSGGITKMPSKKFEEVERQHPYSDWARKALIMVAYARYEAKDYDECISAARRFVTLHPGSSDAALRAVPDRLGVFRADPRRQPRSGPHREGDRRARRGVAQISGFRIRAERQEARSRSRATNSPARKWSPAATT